MYVNKKGYLVSYKTIKNDFTQESIRYIRAFKYHKGDKGYVYMSTVIFPLELVGKRVRFKVEYVD